MTPNVFYLPVDSFHALRREIDHAIGLLERLTGPANATGVNADLECARLHVSAVRDKLDAMSMRGPDKLCECDEEFRQALELIRLARKSLSGAQAESNG